MHNASGRKNSSSFAEREKKLKGEIELSILRSMSVGIRRLCLQQDAGWAPEVELPSHVLRAKEIFVFRTD